MYVYMQCITMYVCMYIFTVYTVFIYELIEPKKKEDNFERKKLYVCIL